MQCATHETRESARPSDPYIYRRRRTDQVRSRNRKATAPFRSAPEGRRIERLLGEQEEAGDPAFEAGVDVSTRRAVLALRAARSHTLVCVSRASTHSPALALGGAYTPTVNVYVSTRTHITPDHTDYGTRSYVSRIAVVGTDRLIVSIALRRSAVGRMAASSAPLRRIPNNSHELESGSANSSGHLESHQRRGHPARHPPRNISDKCSNRLVRAASCGHNTGIGTSLLAASARPHTRMPSSVERRYQLDRADDLGLQLLEVLRR